MAVMLTQEQRDQLRGDILNHPNWKAVSKKLNINSNYLSSRFKVCNIAHTLGITSVNSHSLLPLFKLFKFDDENKYDSSKDSSKSEDSKKSENSSKLEDSKESETQQNESKSKGATMTKNNSMEAAQALMTAIASAVEVDETKLRSIVKDELIPVYEALEKPKILVMKDEKVLGELPPTRHPMAEKLLAALSVKTVDGHALNVWISGPAGSGKTFAVRQVAKALNLEYGFHGAMTMPHELVGFVDAGGTYHETVFVRLYRNGGVCLLDECDAGSNEALLVLNAALANGQMSLPTGEILDRHPDFRAVAAANTFGQGATAEYVGRARIDAAFLDRFGVRLNWGYDEKLEKNISGNPEWVSVVQKARSNALTKGLKVLITPRASISGSALIASGMSFKEAADLTFLAGLSPDQIKAIEPQYPVKKGSTTKKAEPIDF